jgi:hypothetical protein
LNSSSEDRNSEPASSSFFLSPTLGVLTSFSGCRNVPRHVLEPGHAKSQRSAETGAGEYMAHRPHGDEARSSAPAEFED